MQILHIVEIFILAIAGKELGLWFPSNICVPQNSSLENQSSTIWRVSELIVLLDVSILVGEQLFFSEIAFFDHCLQHLYILWVNFLPYVIKPLRWSEQYMRKHTMLVILRTVAWVAISLANANSTACPPWATNIPQYLGNNTRFNRGKWGFR